MELADVDLFDLDRFQAQEHHEMFELLRREAPVFRSVTPIGVPLWHITRWADVRDANRNTALFSSEENGVTLHRAVRSPEEGDEVGDAMNGKMMLTTDPPRHTRYRRLVSRGFTPRMIGQLEELLAWRTSRIIDNVIERGECELVSDVAAELPLQAIADFVGVEQVDRRKMFEWSNAMIGVDDPNLGSPTEAVEAAAELFGYSRRLAEFKKENPGEDIFTVLVNTQDEDDGLTDEEIDMFFLLLSVAGNETTRNATAHGMLALIEHPEEMAKVASFLDDDAKMDQAIDEVVRWGTPVSHFSRTATEDTVIGGQEIAAGEQVVLWHCSSNRDAEAFENPFEFRVDRTPNEHTGFGGGGAHYCLGANLAKLELRLIIRELVRRMPDLRLDGEVLRLRSNFINGINEMPVRFTPGERLDLPCPEGVDPSYL